MHPGKKSLISFSLAETCSVNLPAFSLTNIPQDIQLRLHTLPPPRTLPSYPLHLQNPFPLPQLSTLLTLLNQSLDIIDISTWTGDPHNAFFIAGQLRLLADTINEARQVLKGGEDVVGGRWWEDNAGGESVGFAPPCPPTNNTLSNLLQAFSPAPPPHLSVSLSILDAALVLHLRTLAPVTPDSLSPSSSATASLTGFSLRHRLGLAPRSPPHDELERLFAWKGEQVRVREKVRVESQDPSLISVMAKLSALGHGVAVWRRALAVVMGEEGDGE